MTALSYPDASGAYEKLFYAKLVPPTAAHYASMREDFKRDRRTEIDALNGAIVHYAQQHNLPCPADALLTRFVHAREGYRENASRTACPINLPE